MVKGVVINVIGGLLVDCVISVSFTLLSGSRPDDEVWFGDSVCLVGGTGSSSIFLLRFDFDGAMTFQCDQ